MGSSTYLYRYCIHRHIHIYALAFMRVRSRSNLLPLTESAEIHVEGPRRLRVSDVLLPAFPFAREAAGSVGFPSCDAKEESNKFDLGLGLIGFGD